MSETEQRYSQIENESLALVWACKKLSGYILNKRVHLETDHKPSLSLLCKICLDQPPPRVLQFRLKLMCFDYSINRVLGKLIYIADALSHVSFNEVITDN